MSPAIRVLFPTDVKGKSCPYCGEDPGGRLVRVSLGSIEPDSQCAACEMESGRGEEAFLRKGIRRALRQLEAGESPHRIHEDLYWLFHGIGDIRRKGPDGKPMFEVDGE